MTGDRLGGWPVPSVSRISSREAGACALASLCVPAPCARGKGTVNPTPSVMRARRPQGGRSSPGKTGRFRSACQGRRAASGTSPGVYLPRTATGGYNRPVGLAGGIYLVCSGDVRPVLGINSKGHGRGGVAGTGGAGHGGGVTKRKGHTGKRKRPRPITERP